MLAAGCFVGPEQVQVSFKLGTGAEVNILQKSIADKLQCDINLTHTSQTDG